MNAYFYNKIPIKCLPHVRNSENKIQKSSNELKQSTHARYLKRKVIYFINTTIPTDRSIDIFFTQFIHIICSQMQLKITCFLLVSSCYVVCCVLDKSGLLD